jgi:hypothetical protein
MVPEPEGSTPCSQERTTNPYPEPGESLHYSGYLHSLHLGPATTAASSNQPILNIPHQTMVSDAVRSLTDSLSLTFAATK